MHDDDFVERYAEPALFDDDEFPAGRVFLAVLSILGALVATTLAAFYPEVMVLFLVLVAMASGGGLALAVRPGDNHAG